MTRVEIINEILRCINNKNDTTKEDIERWYTALDRSEKLFMDVLIMAMAKKLKKELKIEAK